MKKTILEAEQTFLFAWNFLFFLLFASPLNHTQRIFENISSFPSHVTIFFRLNLELPRDVINDCLVRKFSRKTCNFFFVIALRFIAFILFGKFHFSRVAYEI